MVNLIECITNAKICISAGGDLRFTVKIKDIEKIAIDITDWNFFFSAKEKISDVAKAIDAKTGDTDSSRIVITDAPNGIIDIIVEASETILLNPKVTYIQDLKYVTDLGDTDYYFRGSLCVEESVG